MREKKNEEGKEKEGTEEKKEGGEKEKGRGKGDKAITLKNKSACVLFSTGMP